MARGIGLNISDEGVPHDSDRDARTRAECLLRCFISDLRTVLLTAARPAHPAHRSLYDIARLHTLEMAELLRWHRRKPLVGMVHRAGVVLDLQLHRPAQAMTSDRIGPLGTRSTLSQSTWAG